MGRNDWQNAGELEDLAQAMAPRQRGRGFRIVGVLLLLGGIALLVGYYIPLYRAHVALSAQYKTLAAESATQRRQLTESIQTLKRISDERDALAASARTEKKQSDAASSQLDRVARELDGNLKKFYGKGRLEKEQPKDPQAGGKAGEMRLTLFAPAVLGVGTAALTDYGKKALCGVASAAKASHLQVKVVAMGVLAQPKGKFSFTVASARAAAVATQLVEACDLAPESLSIEVSQQHDAVERAAQLVLTAGSEPAR